MEDPTIKSEEVLNDKNSFPTSPFTRTKSGTSVKMSHQVTQGNDWITLNVGGETFKTTRDTLCMDHNSMLAKMFSRDSIFPSAAQDDSGAYLIDREPKYFRPLLNFLRTGKLILDQDVNVEGVYEEAEYFQIQALIDTLHPEKRPDLTRRDILLHKASINFEGLQLSNVDFSNLGLSEKNFDRSQLKESNFTHADITSSSFKEVYAPNADFEECKAKKALFSNANLLQCVFNGSDLFGATFLGANLEGCRFVNAQCTSAIFQGSILRRADFRNANLERAKFQGADLRYADMSTASLTYSSLLGADLRGALINWSSACPSDEFATVNIRGCIMTQEQYNTLPLSPSLKGALNVVIKDLEA